MLILSLSFSQGPDFLQLRQTKYPKKYMNIKAGVQIHSRRKWQKMPNTIMKSIGISLCINSDFSNTIGTKADKNSTCSTVNV